jgi:phage-related baseplate assembly protein
LALARWRAAEPVVASHTVGEPLGAVALEIVLTALVLAPANPGTKPTRAPDTQTATSQRTRIEEM